MIVPWLPFALIPLALSIAILLFRFHRGPTNLDRLVVFESITIILICFAGFAGAAYQTEWFLDAALVLSLIGFLSTVALSLRIAREKAP